MKILVVCDQGNNRSVTLAGQLKYLGNDVLTAGLATNDEDTLFMLAAWVDLIIAVSRDIQRDLHPYLRAADLRKVELWNIGPDVYKRPYNKDLLKIVKELIKDHPEVDNRNPRQST